MRRASCSFLLLQCTSATPSRTLSGHLFPQQHQQFTSVRAYFQHTAITRHISRHGRISPRHCSLRSLYNRSHRAHMRLCLTPVSKNKLRLSDNKKYRATGLTGCTRQTCPKKRSTETVSVSISNSPCKSRLISLPIADMAFANVRFYVNTILPLASSSPLSY